MTITTINPATEETLAEYPELSASQIEDVLRDTDAAFDEWRRVELGDRAEHLRALGAKLRERETEYAELMTREMGKPLAQAVSEVQKCASVCDYYAENAADFLADIEIESDASRSFVTYQPLGVVLAIMPWNFPFWQVMRFAAPTLTAGNTGILKHAPNVTGCALALEELFSAAGYPDNVFRTLVVDVPAVDAVIRDPRIKAVTLTGSNRAGEAVASAAGASIKKTVLELGGSDPAVILADADLAAAAAACTTSRLLNAGQSCIAAKRLIVVDEVRDEFEARLVERMSQAVVGDPTDSNTTVGPLARADLRDNLHRQVSESVANGARVLLGGELPDPPGYFYPATLLADVGPGMPAYEEELFGPVASIIPVSDETEALRVANDTIYGLSASVYTRDVERGQQIAAELLDAGACFVNSYPRSDPRLPFGGIKQSGYGRELSPFGIREFVNVKTVWVA
ncbi:MAG: NAD-dependent succinate-semialdehyde dehydrogenase [Gemmatimonadetes bacterium]|jgi:succinate-semialdehyde dehydrogenase/glutarate-semialdehyde dehydrogenase|nr:NAD-dependent succinate-semialdehyde dehydrogenase [Gemmatimonadota bacterium]